MFLVVFFDSITGEQDAESVGYRLCFDRTCWSHPRVPKGTWDESTTFSRNAEVRINRRREMP
jgi:hypothetical protein